MNKAFVVAADENIEALDELLPKDVVLERFSGRNADSADARQKIARCDALLVRSVTSVNENLLRDINPNFVGSATIGTDHIDLDYLAGRSIHFANAPGSNANAVVDYVSAVVFQSYSIAELATKKIGVIGVGNVGSRLCRCLSHFGLSYQTYDPYVTDNELLQSVELDKLLKTSDIISIHVPYMRHGEHATHHLINDTAVDLLKPGCLIINSSRGDVADERALLRRSRVNHDIRIALDVWSGEPDISLNALIAVNIATPHIAGYSVQGRMRAAAMVVDEMRRVFSDSHFHSIFERSNGKAKLNVAESKGKSFGDFTSLEKFREAIHQLFDITGLDAAFRDAVIEKNADSISADARVSGKSFDRFRKQYALRQEINYD